MRKMSKLEVLTLTDDKVDQVVKIQGTKYDRKRKISPDTIKKMNRMASQGKSVAEICKKFNLNYVSVRYNIDPIWRATYNATRSGKHTGTDRITMKDRVAYKRTLVAEGKLTAVA